jgi:hypothetical protein
VKSRSGFIIFLANCPVVWTSKLQTDIATSMMEAEYNALYIAMRDLIPILDIANEILTQIGLPKTGVTKRHKTVVHEDNQGCLKLAKLEPDRMTQRSKHYGVEYHWFRSNLKLKHIEMHGVKSELQRSDFLTKSL